MAGTRLQIVGSFVLFTLFVAPFAYKLTQIERVELPESRISQLVSSKWFNSTNLNSFESFPSIQVYYANKASFEAEMERKKTLTSKTFEYKYQLLDQELENLVQKALMAQKKSINTNKYYETLDENLHNSIQELMEGNDPSTHHSFRIFLLCESKLWYQKMSKAQKKQSPRLFVGPFRHAWSPSCSFAETMKAVERLLQHHIYPTSTHTSKTAEEQETTMRKARSAFNYRLRFNLLKETSSSSSNHQWEWEFDFLFKRFFQNFLQKIQVLGNFTIENQVFQYAKLSSKSPHQHPEKEYYYHLSPQDLQQFMSANDFLSTSVLSDREQVLHFMAALPSLDHSPLVLMKSEKSGKLEKKNTPKYLYRSFEIPRWGNVFILNSTLLLLEEGSGGGSVVLKQKEMDRCFGHFLSQLRRLLGFSSFHKRKEFESTSHTESMIYFLPSLRNGIAEWELDVVARQKVMEYTQTTVQTLGSIVQLVNEMPQMSVLKRVETLVTKALEEMEQVGQLLSEDHQDQHHFYQVNILYQVLAKTLSGAKAAEEAYYDHTMIRQLYFPQEQMFGVYAPLLAPLILPFFLGLIREFKRFRLKKTKKRF